MIQKFYFGFILWLVVVSVQSQSLTSLPNVDPQQISKIVEKSFRQSPVKGLAVGIVSKDSIVYAETFGSTPGAKMNQTTPLWLGSVSKTLTALAVCRLHQLGKLSFDDPITAHLGNIDPHKFQDISIRDLLHHHSGISQESGYSKVVEFHEDFNKVDILAQPGEKGIYSSTNYALLGRIIESTSGLSYAKFMRQYIFQPLGMNSTEIPDRNSNKYGKGYVIFYGLSIPFRQMQYGDVIIPAGYIVSTLVDLNRYALFLLGNGTVKVDGYPQEFLSREVFKSFYETYNKSKTGYAKSWGVSTYQGKTLLSHEGMTKISNAKITLLPEQGIAISVLSNSNSGPFFSISSQLTNKLLAAVFKGPDESKVLWEYIIRISMGFLVLKSIYDFTRLAIKWNKVGKPLQMQFDKRRLLAYLFDAAPIVVLFLLPKIIHVSLDMLFRVMPDVALAVVFTGLLGIGQVFLRLVTQTKVPSKELVG